MRKMVIIASMLLSTQATARAYPRLVVPADGSSLDRAPTDVILIFRETVKLGYCRFTLQDAHGTPIYSGPLNRAWDARTKVVGRLPPLDSGKYTVTWHVTALDMSRSDGKFTFTVDP